MVKAIIFDMDGVLIDSHGVWFAMFNEALSHFENKKISQAEFDKNIWAKNFNATSKSYFSVPRDEILDYFNKGKEKFLDNVSAYKDAAATLAKLKEEGFKLAVATNTHSLLASGILEKADLGKYFDLILGGDQVKNGKPEPDILIKTLKDLKLKKRDVVFIGDTIWDRIAAKKAKIKFVGLRIDGNQRIEDLSDLLKLVQK